MRHAKAGWKGSLPWDFMRKLNKKGRNDLRVISTYLSLNAINPDLIITSCALRAQETADTLALKLDYQGKVEYMNELYLTGFEKVLYVLSRLEDQYKEVFMVGHNPVLTELVTELTGKIYAKFPTTGVMALKLDIESWKDISNIHDANIDFFIYPNQFKYYMPNQIKTKLQQK